MFTREEATNNKYIIYVIYITMKGTRGEKERENDAKTFKKHIVYGSSFVCRIVGIKKRRDF